MWPGQMESQGEATVNEIEDQERRISGGETPQLRRGYDGAGQQQRRAAAEEEELGIAFLRWQSLAESVCN